MKSRNSYLLLILFVSTFTILMETVAVIAQPTVELAYDDGMASGSTSLLAGQFIAVRFSLPSGWSEGKLLTARVDVLAGANKSFKVHILDSDGITQLITPLEVTPTSTGWFDVDLSAFDLTVTDDFYIAIEFEEDNNPWIGYDKTAPIDRRSYHGQPSNWYLYEDRDIMIRAVVQRPAPPVGGAILPVTRLHLLIPYLVMLITAISIIIAVKRRIL